MMASAALAQSPAAAPSASVQQAPQLIQASLGASTAQAGNGRTRDASSLAQPRTAVQAAVAKQADEESSRGAGLPMLLAALALMTGIALRRWGAGPQ
jgi:hypothetical protein